MQLKKVEERCFRCFSTFFSCKADYSRFLKDCQRDTQQKRCYWRHRIEGSLSGKVQNPRKRGRCLAREHGLAYEELLLSDELQACGGYLENVLLNALSCICAP